jgi:hypothetical protein
LRPAAAPIPLPPPPLQPILSARPVLSVPASPPVDRPGGLSVRHLEPALPCLGRGIIRSPKGTGTTGS